MSGRAGPEHLPEHYCCTTNRLCCVALCVCVRAGVKGREFEGGERERERQFQGRKFECMDALDHKSMLGAYLIETPKYESNN